MLLLLCLWDSCFLFFRTYPAPLTCSAELSTENPTPPITWTTHLSLLPLLIPTRPLLEHLSTRVCPHKTSRREKKALNRLQHFATPFLTKYLIQDKYYWKKSTAIFPMLKTIIRTPVHPSPPWTQRRWHGSELCHILSLLIIALHLPLIKRHNPINEQK